MTAIPLYPPFKKERKRKMEVKMKRIKLIILCLVFVTLITAQAGFAAKKADAINPNDYPAISAEELGQLKWVLKLANEPLEDFADMNSLDQVGITASRYTLAFTTYFLAAEQYHKLSAWDEAIKPAFDRVIQKMFLKPVWEYWSHDSAGVTKFEPLMDKPYAPFSDPIAYRNIMYSGHVSQMINLYHMLYNERKYDAPDSIVLKWDDKTKFLYNNESLQDAMFAQLIKNPVPAIECEPNAIFPACNTHPHLGWKLYDQMHGTHYYAAGNPLFMDFFKKQFVDPKTGELGAFYLMKQGWVFSASNPRYGNKMDPAIQKMIKEGVTFGSSGNEGWIMTGIHVFDPAFVEKLYPDFKKLHVIENKDGSVTLQKDVLTPYSYYGFFCILAAEMGDEKILKGLFKTIDAHFDDVWGDDGTYHYPYKVFAGGPNLAAADDAKPAASGIKPPVKMNDITPQMKTWPQHSDLSDRLFAMARALPKNGLLKMYNNPFDQQHFIEPAITGVDLSTTLLKRAVYDRNKQALIISTMPSKTVAKADFKVIRLDPSKTYELYLDGNPLNEMSGIGEYIVSLDNSKGHDIILKQK
jgi:hypothetical protein